jgi:hypothetical protein
MKRWLIMLGFFSIGVVLANCGDDPKVQPNNPNDAGPTPTSTATSTATSTPQPDAGPDAATKRTSCLDRPGAPPRPSDRLPCDLIPPGLALP